MNKQVTQTTKTAEIVSPMIVGQPFQSPYPPGSINGKSNNQIALIIVGGVVAVIIALGIVVFGLIVSANNNNQSYNQGDYSNGSSEPSMSLNDQFYESQVLMNSPTALDRKIRELEGGRKSSGWERKAEDALIEAEYQSSRY